MTDRRRTSLLMTVAAFAVVFACGVFSARAMQDSASKKGRLYEMRIYHTLPGKLDALNARFRDHTTKLFEKHGMENVGYWVPQDEARKNQLIYILAFSDRAARDKSFKEFGADPEWKTAREASEKGGKIVEKVESIFLSPTDYSKLK
jgi:hypothetical protein